MKTLLLIIMTLMATNIAYACEGTTITGVSGNTYCLSDHTMNWYSSYAWCKDQGMDLINVKSICGQLTGKCSDLILNNNIAVWANTAASAYSSYAITLSEGNISSYRSRADLLNALCK